MSNRGSKYIPCKFSAYLAVLGRSSGPYLDSVRLVNDQPCRFCNKVDDLVLSGHRKAAVERFGVRVK